MTLQECLDKLARSKISNLAFSEHGSIKEGRLDRVIDAINEGLNRIYTVLPIKEKNIILELTESRTDYVLTSEHCLSKATGSIYDSYDFYIRDTPSRPFLDDILVITEVQDDLDRKRPINDPEDPLAVFIPQQNLLSINYTNSARVLNILYRAKHLELTQFNLEAKIELPDNLIGALLSYTAYQLHNDMNTQEAVTNAQKYYAEFQSIINEVISNGIFNGDKSVSDNKFHRRGQV